MSRNTPRQSTPGRPMFRIWECLWEVDNNFYYNEVEVSVFILEPEIIAAKAGIPPTADRVLTPKLVAQVDNPSPKKQKWGSSSELRGRLTLSTNSELISAAAVSLHIVQIADYSAQRRLYKAIPWNNWRFFYFIESVFGFYCDFSCTSTCGQHLTTQTTQRYCIIRYNMLS